MHVGIYASPRAFKEPSKRHYLVTLYLIVGTPCSLQSFVRPDKQPVDAISPQFRMDARQIYQLE